MEILLYGEEGLHKVTLLRTHRFFPSVLLIFTTECKRPGDSRDHDKDDRRSWELREMIHDVSGRRSVGLWGECCKSPSRSS